MATSEKEKVNIERITNLLKASFTNVENDNSITTEEKLNTIIHATSITCATIAIQPIPFADALILTPIQTVMIAHMTNVMKKDVLKKELNDNAELVRRTKTIDTKDILVTITSATGVGLLAQQGIIGLYKTFIPFLGAITTIPMVYATTYAIGKVAKMVIESQLKGEVADKAHIKDVFKKVVKTKEKEIKEKDDLNEFLYEENEKIDKKYQQANQQNKNLTKEVQELRREVIRLGKEIKDANQRIEDAYNQNNGTVILIEKNEEIKTQIYEMIEEARESIYISIFDINDYELLFKLQKRSSEGVVVKIITDYDRIANSTYSNKTKNRIRDCFNQRNTMVKLYGKNIEGINHQKDIIVDNLYMISGSANFTSRALNKNIETVFFVSDTNLVYQKLNSFNSLFASKNLVTFDGKNF